MPGFPIRTPSDHSSVDSSPRTIAASHVLHRLLMPRHPPCALDNLTNTPANITKKQFKQNCCWKNSNREQDARVHCTILNDHTDHPEPATMCEPGMTACRENTTPTPRNPDRLFTSRPEPPGAGTVVLSGPNSAPSSVFPHFLEQPHTLSQRTPTPPQGCRWLVLVRPSTQKPGRGRGHSPRRSHPEPGVR